MDKPQAEIIAIGNEILLGQVQDTNAHWLAKKIVSMGGRVRRMVVVGDDPPAIIQEIRGALAREPVLLVTTGGLGPTADDLTLAAVAEAVGRPLDLNPPALQMVEKRYAKLARLGFVADAALTRSRLKMAYLPSGAEPLANSVGTAPGSLLRLDPTTLISLPGVPGEMMAIWEESLASVLKEIFGENIFLEKTVTVQTRDESSLAPILQELAEKNPEVY
ncbi:MAG: competence/damage-inducible protein A, partial [Chloroflexi bacterium]|nr:competence/damage-inducible protein A [Chloroflexota bacterium]